MAITLNPTSHESRAFNLSFVPTTGQLYSYLQQHYRPVAHDTKIIYNKLKFNTLIIPIVVQKRQKSAVQSKQSIVCQ